MFVVLVVLATHTNNTRIFIHIVTDTIMAITMRFGVFRLIFAEAFLTENNNHNLLVVSITMLPAIY